MVYDSTVAAGEGEGVYVRAVCRELSEFADVQRAHGLLQARSTVPYWALNEVQAPAPVRLYEAVAQEVWMNDGDTDTGQYVDVRRAIDLR